MTHHRRLPLIVGLPMAVATGLFIPVQGRINGALGVALGDGIGAAVVSFSTGLVVMTVISLALPRGRAGLARILPAVRERQFPPYYVLAGCIGALFVFAQSFTVGLLGVALFPVAAVAWAVSPRFSAGESGLQLLVPVMLPLLAGFLMSFQQAMNGTATVHYGTPIAATLVNFIAG